MNATKLVLATTALTAVSGIAIAEDLTFVSWGGAYQNSQLKAYAEPYMEMHPDVNIVWDESSAEAVAKLRAMNEAGNITWDLVDVTVSDSIRLCDEGLAKEIDFDEALEPAPDGTPASEDFGNTLVNDCFIPQIVYSTTFGYRTDLVGDTPPTTVCDVFDLEAYPGKRSLQKRPIDNMEWALYCDGVASDEIYDVLGTEEGQARAFAKLDTIKNDVVWWEAGAQPPQLLADGEVVMTTAYNGRIFNAVAAEGKPFEIVWDGQVWDIDLWAIPKGAPNMENALEFLKFSTDTQRLADQAKWIAYGPARKSSAPLVGKYNDGKIDMGPQMPTSPDNLKTAIQNNFEFWADNQDQLNERFNAWLAN